jgi:hypothetical protein
MKKSTKCYCGHTTYCDCGPEEPKQEKLEEAMSKDGYHESDYDKIWREGVEFGVKWQAERMYSEEDMIEFAEWIANSKLHGYSKQLYEAMIIYKVKTTKDLLKVWFEQFKKK